ncbi:MAG: hypothetical protein ACHQQ3_08885 [Gemmatimonadales bacterium]
MSETSEWSRDEREAFAALERTMPIDAAEEERTVGRLRSEALLGVRPELRAREAGWPRSVRIGLAIAAGLACFLAGRWAERSAVFGRRDGIASRGTGEPHMVLADSQMRAPIVRF